MTTPHESSARSDPGTTPRPGPRLWPAGLGAAVIATAATTAIAAISRAADVSLDVDGEAIPLGGFATMTFLWSVFGVLVAAGMARWTPAPRRVWVTTTVLLTVVSCIPPLTADADTATQLVLTATHLVAAVIVIPAVASRLPERRS